MKRLFPSRAVAVLLFIGFLDLVVTAVLHAQGLIVELNPIMRPLIERSEWLFALVKAATLVAAWAALVWYAPRNLDFVKKASLYGAGAYVFIWTTWFIAASF
ncbi:MAG: DUF5658 family protein [Fimbriimonadaceae bacterium]